MDFCRGFTGSPHCVPQETWWRAVTDQLKAVGVMLSAICIPVRRRFE